MINSVSPEAKMSCSKSKMIELRAEAAKKILYNRLDRYHRWVSYNNQFLIAYRNNQNETSK